MTRAQLRGGAILAALRNYKIVDLRVNPRLPCVDVPHGCDFLRLSLRMRPKARMRVSPLGLHATIERQGIRHQVCVPWYAITAWTVRM